MTTPVTDPLDGLVMPPGDPARLDQVALWLTATANSLGGGGARQRAAVRAVVGVSWTGGDAERLATAVEEIAERAVKTANMADQALSVVRSCQGGWMEAIDWWRRARTGADEAISEETTHRLRGAVTAANMDLLERHADPVGYAAAVAASDGSDGYMSVSRFSAQKLGRQAVDQANWAINVAISDIDDVTAALNSLGPPEPYQPAGSGRRSTTPSLLTETALGSPLHGSTRQLGAGSQNPHQSWWGNIVSHLEPAAGPLALTTLPAESNPHRDINVPWVRGPQKNINVPPPDLEQRRQINVPSPGGPQILITLPAPDLGQHKQINVPDTPSPLINYAKQGKARPQIPDPAPRPAAKQETDDQVRDQKNGAESEPARFIVGSDGTVIDPESIGDRISTQRQARHLLGGSGYTGGGYFLDQADAQQVLDAFHSGHAIVLGPARGGGVYVEYPKVTGYNNNPGAGYFNQPTNVFMIKGSSSVSVVPVSPARGSS